MGVRRLRTRVDPRDPRWSRSLVKALPQSQRYDEAWAAYQTFEDPDYETRMWVTLLGAREHRDPARVARKIEDLDREFAGKTSAFNLMFARAMARDYEGALAVLETMPEPPEDGPPPSFGVPDKLLFELQIRWLMGDEERAFLGIRNDPAFAELN